MGNEMTPAGHDRGGDDRLEPDIQDSSALLKRASAALRTRAKKEGKAYGPAERSSIERHGRKTFLVLRTGNDVIGEFEVRNGHLRFVLNGPARKLREQQQRDEKEERELDALTTAETPFLIDRALTCLHALNRYAKELRWRVNWERIDERAAEDYGDCEPFSDGRYTALQSKIYGAKDRFLNAMLGSGRASVGVFEVSKPGRQRSCSICGRSWVGDSRCYNCNTSSGDAAMQSEKWYVVDCGGGYRFHRPGLPEALASLAVPIEPHDPTQPTRDVPDVGLSIERQLRCVEIAIARLEEATMPIRSAPHQP